MLTKECPSCGSMVEEGQLYCPSCGTKLVIESAKKKAFNKEFEAQLIQVDNYAEVCLSKNLGAGIGGSINYENINKCEGLYLQIVEQFPTESRAYIAYVDFMIKRTEKLAGLKGAAARTDYFIGDINLIINRCRQYLVKAKQFANDEELEQILQMDSLVSSKLEAIANDKSILKGEERKKKWAKAGMIVLVGTFLLWLICEIAGI